MQLTDIGACVGNRGARVNAVVEELGGEKIDIILWNEDPLAFIYKALSPATVLSVTARGERSAMAIVPDEKLSLAIGRDGQNARLAARLTGWKIDVKSASSPEAAEVLAQIESEEAEEIEEKGPIYFLYRAKYQNQPSVMIGKVQLEVYLMAIRDSLK